MEARAVAASIVLAPFVFARNKLRKPAHGQVVKMSMRAVLCHNGCGLYYTAPSDEEWGPGDGCPDCHQKHKPWTVASEPEDVLVTVQMAFGNQVDVQFLRSCGTITQRIFGFARLSLGRVFPFRK